MIACPAMVQTQGVAEDVEKSLDPRSVTVQRVGGWITVIVIGALSLSGVLLLLFLINMEAVGRFALFFGWLLLVTVLVFAAQFWPGIEYRYARYRVSPRGLEIRRGVLWREHAFVPRSRVQHTDVSQGPLERQFGLSTLIVYTAGTAHASVHLPGLPRDVALAIRDFLVTGGRDDGV